jgi:hypothetical protein
MDKGSEMLVEAYDKHGVQGVLDLIREWGAKWGWEECVPCEQVTATYDGVCGVCFTEREES